MGIIVVEHEFSLFIYMVLLGMVIIYYPSDGVAIIAADAITPSNVL